MSSPKRPLIVGAALLFGALSPGCVEDSEDIGPRDPREGGACERDEASAAPRACDADTNQALVCNADQLWEADPSCYCDDAAEVSCAVPGFVGLRSAQRPVATHSLRRAG